MTKTYGHRGFKGSYPENSMLSFKKAIEAKVDGMEFDVHLTKDNHVVVIHDATLDRTTTGAGFIKDYTLEEIRSFSIGEKFTEFKHYNPSWNDEVVPTLQEVLALCLAHDLEVNIELKTYEIAYPKIEEAVVKIVEASGYKKDRVVYSSFHLPTLLRLKSLDNELNIAWLIDFLLPMPADYINSLELEALHLDKNVILANPEYFRPIADKIRAWTVNDPSEMKTLLELGMRSIITDYPENPILFE